MHMIFPDWVEKPGRQSPVRRAEKRIRYLISQAAMQHDGKLGMPDFSKNIGYDRTAVHRAVAGGRFPRNMAKAAEAAYGEDLLPAAWLTNPLDIPTKG